MVFSFYPTWYLMGPLSLTTFLNSVKLNFCDNFFPLRYLGAPSRYLLHGLVVSLSFIFQVFLFALYSERFPLIFLPVFFFLFFFVLVGMFLISINSFLLVL